MGLGIPSTGSTVRVDGREVVVETDQLEGRFVRVGPLSDIFMVFGGSNQQLRNQLQHVLLATLAIGDAQLIHQRYPDFHLSTRCG